MHSISISLNQNQIQRVQEYHDWIEKKQTDLKLTDYWELHLNKIAIEFEKGSITLTGESGFYFPKNANCYTLLRHYTSLLPINLSYWIFIFFRKLLNRPYDFLTSYPKAYDSVRNHDPILRWNPSSKRMNWKNLQNNVLNFKTISGMKKKWPDSKTHILSDATIRSYFYLQLIEDKIRDLKNSTVCEIGPGTGNMTPLFYHHFNNKLFLVDLPRTFLFSFVFLAQTCPTAKIALLNEVADKNFNPEGYDIIMPTPQNFSHKKPKY